MNLHIPPTKQQVWIENLIHKLSSRIYLTIDLEVIFHLSVGLTMCMKIGCECAYHYDNTTT